MSASNLPRPSAFRPGPTPPATTHRVGGEGRPALDRLSAALPGVALVGPVVGLGVGSLSFLTNSLDAYRFPVIGLLLLSLALLAAHVWHEDSTWSGEIVGLFVVVAIVGLILAWIPEYLYGRSVNGIIHRSLFSAILLTAVSLPLMSTALYYVLGATPTARDLSRYPIVVVPIAMALFVYGAILIDLVERGAPDLTWHAVTHAYSSNLVGDDLIRKSGIRNHIYGTFLLMFMTSAIALPIGVGTGLFVSEYDGRLAKVISFSTQMLRAISVFILAISAYSLVKYTADNYPGTNVFTDLIRGSFTDSGGYSFPQKGSFLLASVFLSLLVIPVIARATEEGLRSIPRDIREGSQALGATEGHALLRILLPWTLPNIVTGLLLGAAEAAGSVTVLLFIAGGGQYGVGPRHEATSLAYLIFNAGRGATSFTSVMSQFQFSAALLLVMITFGLTVAALILKQRFAKRYRAGISYE
jgi:phosphate transport system permease protein